MYLYTVTVVVDAPPDQNEGKPYRAIEYSTSASTTAQARAIALDHHRATRPHDGQVHTVVVDPPCPGSARKTNSYSISPEDLQRIKAGRAVYHA